MFYNNMAETNCGSLAKASPVYVTKFMGDGIYID